MFKNYSYLEINFHIISNKEIRKNIVKDSWQNCHHGQLENFFEKTLAALYSP